MRYVLVAVGLEQTALLVSGRRIERFESASEVAADRCGTNRQLAAGVILPPIIESPRKKVVGSTSQVIGPTIIACNGHGEVTQRVHFATSA